MEPTPNIPLLRKAVEWVEEQDALGFENSQWYQSDWVRDLSRDDAAAEIWTPQGIRSKAPSCGTVYCVAGYVAALNGYTHEPTDYNLYGSSINPQTGEAVEADIYAQQQLGLTSDQAMRLFFGGNRADDVRRIAEDIAGERL